MRKRSKLFLFPLALSVILSGVAIGGGFQRGLVGNQTILKAEDSTNNESTYTFTKEVSKDTSIKVDENITWKIAVTNKDSKKEPYYGHDATKGAQFGTGKNPIKELIFTSDNNKSVSEIIVNCSGASDTDATLNVTIGEQYTSASKSLTDTSTSYSLKPDSPVTGSITLSFKCTKKAIYVKSIIVKYGQQISTENKYVVSFDNDGNVTKSYVSDDGITKLEEPSKPTKDGYAFDGWYNGDTKWNFDDPVTEDMTLTAKFIDIEFTNIKDATEDGEIYRIKGKITSLANNSTAYIQNGDDAIELSQSSINVKEGNIVELKGKKGTSNEMPQLTDIFDIKTIEEEISFSTITDINHVSKENSARYVSLKGLKLASGFSGSGTKTAALKDSSIKLAYKNKDFVNNDPTKFKADDFVDITGNIEIYNTTTEIMIDSISYSETATVSFDSNGGNETIASQIILVGNKVVKPSDPTKNPTAEYRYSFAGWYTQKDDSGSLFDFDTAISTTDNFTLYAHWNAEKIPVQEIFKNIETKSSIGFNYTKTIEETEQAITDEAKTRNDITGTKFQTNGTKYNDNSIKLDTYGEYIQYNIQDTPITDITFSFDAKLNITGTIQNSTFTIIVYDKDEKEISTSGEGLTNTEYKTFSYKINKVCNGKSPSQIKLIYNKNSGNMGVKNINVSYSIMNKKDVYSDFNNAQLRFKNEFDVSNVEEVTKTGIFVTDDLTYDFDKATEALTVSEGKVFLDFENKTKKASWYVGVNIDESHFSTEIVAAGYIVVDGIYYFNNPSKYSIKTILEQYQKNEELSKDKKDIISSFYGTIAK